MFIIGITGPTGSGKTTASAALQSQGVFALDCDEIYSRLLETDVQLICELLERFPETVATKPNDKTGISPGIKSNAETNAGTGNEDGSDNGAKTDTTEFTAAVSAVDKTKLRSLVFNDAKALSDLETITHKYVVKEIDRLITEHMNNGGTAVSIDAIALIESGYGKRCDAILCITAPKQSRIERITERDGISRQDAGIRADAQKTDEFYRKNSSCTVENTYDSLENFKSACIRAYKIEKWFFEHTGEMVSELSELVAVNSVRSKSEDGAPYGRASRDVLQTGQRLIEKHGLSVSVFEDMVITANLGPEPVQLGILTHLDIVAAGDQWDTDPFILTICGGRLFGRGVMDNKGPAIASMYAAYCVRDLFSPELKRGVQLILGSGEETGFDDIARYAGCNKMPPYVFSPDAEFPVVNIEKGRFMPVFGAKWEKEDTLPRVISITGGKTPNIVPDSAFAVIEGAGLEDVKIFCDEHSSKTGVELYAEQVGETIKITAKGACAHASRPHLGRNAQSALLGMLAVMPFAQTKGFGYICSLAKLFPYGDHYGKAIGLAMQDGISGRTTVNFGVLRFDELGFSAGFDARTALCADDTDILKLTESIISQEGMTISYHEYKPSHHTPEESPFVQTLLRVYEKYTAKKGECICVGGLTYIHGIPGGVAFGCTMPQDDNNIHSANEHIDLKQLVMCSKIFTQVILEICADAPIPEVWEI